MLGLRSFGLIGLFRDKVDCTRPPKLPDVDVAAAGGWSDLTWLKTCYQQADAETMLGVVNASI